MVDDFVSLRLAAEGEKKGKKVSMIPCPLCVCVCVHVCVCIIHRMGKKSETSLFFQDLHRRSERHTSQAYPYHAGIHSNKYKNKFFEKV